MLRETKLVDFFIRIVYLTSELKIHFKNSFNLIYLYIIESKLAIVLEKKKVRLDWTNLIKKVFSHRNKIGRYKSLYLVTEIISVAMGVSI